MTRYRRGKKALYEVMSEARLKPGYGRTLGKMLPEKPGEDEPSVETEVAEVTQDNGPEETPQVSVRWRRKPRTVQFNAGRVEFSLPYPIAIAVVLGLVVVVLVAFRAGQLSYRVSEAKSNNPPVNVGGNREDPVVRQETNTITRTREDAGNVGAVTPTGNNVIVLVQHGARADLEPVRTHFSGYGIETEIVNWDGKYYLITKARFRSFGAGTDGYVAKQRIAEVGAKYKGKAPEGYESFAPHYFSDAYGKKVN